LAYEQFEDKPSGCSAGISAKIHRIAEIVQPQVCTIPINFIKNDTTPPSYKFSAELPKPGPEGVKFYWSFGDGSTSELATPTHAYKITNTYIVKFKLVFKDGTNCYGELKETFVGETNRECKAYFTATNKLWSDPAMIKKMAFANLSTGDIKECLWNFGDSTTSTELRPTHEYATFGEYKVCLAITTVSGCKSDYCAVVKVEEIPLVTGCKFDLVIKPKPESASTFLFYAISKAEIKTWSWSFGDGHTSNSKNPEHVYEKTGIYEVSCTVTTQDGCTEKRSIRHTVLAAPLKTCPGAIN
jgi:chitodextrinase